MGTFGGEDEISETQTPSLSFGFGNLRGRCEAPEFHTCSARIERYAGRDQSTDALAREELGAPFFHRKHNALELTFAGSTLFSAVNAGLNIISGGINLLTPTAAPEITISATDALATYWLKPLIDSFRAEHPDVHFTVLASDDDPSLSQHSGVDIALLCGNERFEIGDALHLMYPEIGQPVCTPAFLREHGPFPDAESLTGVNLLHLHERHWSSGAIQWHPLG